MTAATPAPMTLDEFNAADDAVVSALLAACLDIPEWVDAVRTRRPFPDVSGLRAHGAGQAALITWDQVAGALARHPRIGQRPTGDGVDARWSAGEQAGVRDDERDAFARANAEYEQRFGFIFLICATGLSGEQMLAALRQRLHHDEEQERPVVITELGKIAALRLERAVTA
ncbi:2-oxo-4-hydroxy-4-carboxy-5-ureidoimidazoline decarboxylase [Nakamurella leprariae]|uniref:2-oxo-4-hydroxy-4-carboxy-5-ureidoimidazoline decarboxylase n=1 Tax=Nakamurella leprariae TaxID=2803911 RepID=A0A939C283_9ACTN|nr:2-oxo-4-hydroxy-4-carboxy-5-ureidoimidazoline decarboxylase [Nakamurella leprariae]MBM9467862.1 2-oxo-4-hydroxy-4-carboxy-5-ureidoimidazoline decarboxylase [Nakamurella leprariae]